MRKSGVWCVMVAIVALVVGCSPAPAPDQESPDAAVVAELTRYLDGAVKRHEFRGAVEVQLGTKVLLSKGFDQADVAGKAPNGPDTRFRLASITKQFTGLAVLILQEQGKLRVTDPVCVHLPDCPATWTAITVDQLLTHTSGLFEYSNVDEAEANRFSAEFGAEPTPAELTQLFVNRPLVFAPGSKAEYSNSGYILLGRLIEQLSGQTYGQFLQDRIFDPLHMSDTGYQPDPSPTGHDAIGYQEWTVPAMTLTDAVYFAGGGIRSTAHDLARWQQFLLTGAPAVVKPDTLAQLLEPRVKWNAIEQYGYGIQTRGAGADITHFHDGGIAGFATYHEIHPATGLAIIVLSNLDTANAVNIGRNLAAMMAE